MEGTTEINKSLEEKYRNKMVEGMIQEIQRLDSYPEFVRDDSFHGYEAKDHIMYKLGTLYSKDRKRAYEFLFEFDKKDLNYGIYFGCKGLIFDGDLQEQIDIFDKEWSTIKVKLINELDRATYRKKLFNLRIKITNNCNDFTYWPFWIQLDEVEDITTKGRKMLSIIREVYKEKCDLTEEFDGTDYHHKSGPTRIIQKAQTHISKWEELPFKDGWADKTRKVLSTFLQGYTDDSNKKHIVVAIYIVLHAIAYDEKKDRKKVRRKFRHALFEIAPDFCENIDELKRYIDEFYSNHGKYNDLDILLLYGKPFESENDVEPDKYGSKKDIEPDKYESIKGFIRNSCYLLYKITDKKNVSNACEDRISGITKAAETIYNALI